MDSLNALTPQSAFFDAFTHSPAASTSTSTLVADETPKDLEQYFHFEEFSSGPSEAQSPVTPSHSHSPFVDILSAEGTSPAPDPFLSSFLSTTLKNEQHEQVTHTAVDFSLDFPLPDPLLDAPVPPPPLSVPSTNTPNLNIDLSVFGEKERRAIVQMLADFSNQDEKKTTTIEPSMLQQAPVPTPAPVPAPVSECEQSIQHEEEADLFSIQDRVRSGSVASTSASTSGTGDVKMEMDWQQLALKPLPPMFGGEKGKGGKKGGGMSSVVRMTDEDVDDEDSWRPSPEEYKKLSSKEKRQLRNKLSARAFRTRRKDYIGTLESHIKDRDHIIDVIRTELSSTKSENQDLRKELEALKQSTMNILGNVPQPPAPVRKPSTPRFPLNTRKDLPATLASVEASRGFWGGNDGGMFAGGSTTCHTLLTPDLVLPVERNLNPLLNSLEPPIERYSLQYPANGRDIASAPFRQWAEETPFTLRSMDAYRMQIWGRLAREAAAEKSGLGPDARPKFFTEVKQSAEIADVASATITTKLAQAFWAAFQGPQGTDHMADIVTGKSKLAVVDKEDDSLSAAFGGLKLATGHHGQRENPLKTMSTFFSLAKGVHA